MTTPRVMTEAENRKATHERFARCENARKVTTEAALARGIDFFEARRVGHAAATAIWNAWAAEMLSRRAVLQDEGMWKVQRSNFGEEPASSETAFWFAEAAAYFSGVNERRNFDDTMDCSGWIFPGSAGFDNTSFSKRVSFEGTRFEGLAWFDKVKFEGVAWFEAAKFCSVCWFDGATFKDVAGFNNTLFNDHAVFDGATFDSPAGFDGAVFKRGASFHAILTEGSFYLNGAKFDEAPNFVQAKFSEPITLDDILVRPTSGNRSDLSRRYRWLRKIAEQGKDADRELQFFAGEVRASRGVTDHPLPKDVLSASDWAGVVRWWSGWAYDLFADFGRSIVRPLLLLVCVGYIAMICYLGETPNVQARRAIAEAPWVVLDPWWSTPCFAGDATRDGLPEPLRNTTNARREAMQLAARNAFVVLEAGTEANTRTLGCLYGFTKGDTTTNTPRLTIMPAEVSFIVGVQKLLSAICLFLIGLGFRNMLKMK